MADERKDAKEEIVKQRRGLEHHLYETNWRWDQETSLYLDQLSTMSTST